MASKPCFFPDDLGPKKATKAILHQFWKKFGYRGNKSPVSRLPHAKTIKRLIEIIEMVAIIYPSATRKTIAARRLSFDKTAKLFEASTELGAILANTSLAQQEQAAAFGRHIGTAFQLMDDLLDYTANAEQMGKNAGDDLREGKPTLPLIYLLENGTTEERLLVRAAIEQNQDLPEDVFSQILNAVQNSGALDYTQVAAKKEADLALESLKHFPENEATKALYALCEYSLVRQT